MDRWRRRGRARALGTTLVLALGLAGGCASDGSLGALGDVLEQAGLPGLAGGGGAGLDESTIANGLREALRVGTQNAVARTSRLDGFLGSEAIRIPLPEGLDPMARALRTVGFGRQVDELEVAMNRAAEKAAGEAAEVFLGALRQMTIADARDILQGPDTAATDYFRRSTSEDLRSRFEPIVSDKMRSVGLVRMYEDLVGQYRALPLPATHQPPEIQSYVTDRALDGLFHVLGEEEQRIRTDPAARVTELLQTVFGS